MSEIAIFLTLILCIAIMSLRRKYAAIPLFLSIIFFGANAKLDIGSITVTASRLVIICGVLRSIFKNEYKDFKWIKVDTAIVWWSIVLFCMYIVQRLNIESVVWISAFVLDSTISYFLFRMFFRNWVDITLFLRVQAIAIIPIALCMVIENRMHTNLLVILGAKSESLIRDGRYRSVATFAHPILSGMLGTASIAYTSSLLFNKAGKTSAIISIIASLLIIITCASSGALVAFVVVFMTLFAYKIKGKKTILISIFFLLIVMQILMSSPIWNLSAKIGKLIGGTGSHRSKIIDAAIFHISEWWLFGTQYTGNWMPYHLSNGNSDITNHFLIQGIHGGIISIILFIILVIVAFKVVAKSYQITKTLNKNYNLTIYTLGVALIGHVVVFMSVSYFDQSKILFSMLLALISSSSVIVSNIFVDNNNNNGSTHVIPIKRPPQSHFKMSI